MAQLTYGTYFETSPAARKRESHKTRRNRIDGRLVIALDFSEGDKQ